MVIFNSYVCLSEGKPPFSYVFPMVFLWFSYGLSEGKHDVCLLSSLRDSAPKKILIDSLHLIPSLRNDEQLRFKRSPQEKWHPMILEEAAWIWMPWMMPYSIIMYHIYIYIYLLLYIIKYVYIYDLHICQSHRRSTWILRDTSARALKACLLCSVEIPALHCLNRGRVVT